MDLFGQIMQVGERFREAKQARSRARAALFQRAFSEILPETLTARQAALRWSVENQDPDEASGMLIGNMHPGLAAVQAVSKALADYDIQGTYTMRPVGMERRSGHGAYATRDGDVIVELTLRSYSGVNRAVNVPVSIRQGRVIDPSVVADGGYIKPMCQDTFDEILREGTFTAPQPDRLNMFSPPAEHRVPRPPVVLVRPGLFGFGEVNRRLSKSFIEYAVSGQRPHSLPGFDATRRAAFEGVDPAEREVPDLAAGDDVSLTKKIDVVARDGSVWTLTVGSKGTILRDHDGTGESYTVRFEDGFTARVGADAIKKA